MAYKDKANAYKYNNKFIAENYDRVNLTMKQGKKEILQATAKSYGMSTNEFINNAIEYYTAYLASGGGFENRG